MFWKLICERPAQPIAPTHADGRFNLHRHHDTIGPHLDLRLEQPGEDYLLGWRIDAPALDGEVWASEKAPHPVRWLDRDDGPVCLDSGAYQWIQRTPAARLLLLNGLHGQTTIRIDPETAFSPEAARNAAEALESCSAKPGDTAQLIRDGVTARRRAVARLCGLARELDGGAFDEPVWRKTLGQLTLDDLHAQLRGYEVRFDQKYPPQPVSQSAPLPAAKPAHTGFALTLARSE